MLSLLLLGLAESKIGQDWFHNPQYQIQIVSKPVDAHIVGKMQCRIPTSSNRLEEPQPSTEMIASSISSIKCMYYIHGYWTYEFCPGKDISQYHQHLQQIGPEYSLGRTIAEQSVVSNNLVQVWTDGTPCDLNGKPRQTEIEYQCSPVLSDMISSVREVGTCKYRMVILTNRVCPYQPHSYETIQCFVDGRESGFEQYLNSQDELK